MDIRLRLKASRIGCYARTLREGNLFGVLQTREISSLKAQCLACIIHYLHECPIELLSLLPTRQRKEILTCLPALDIFRLESTPVVNGVDMNEVWRITSQLCAAIMSIPSMFTNPRTSLENDMAIKSFYDKFNEDEEITLFLAEAVHVLLHDTPPIKTVHNSIDVECGWGKGAYPSLFWRLFALPFHSEIAKCYSKMRRTSRFKVMQRMLIPFRYAGYFNDDLKIIALELFKMIVTDHQFQSKVLSIHCEFMYHTDLYQSFLHDRNGNWSQSPAWRPFVEFLSKLEYLEFCWLKWKPGWKAPPILERTFILHT